MPKLPPPPHAALVSPISVSIAGQNAPVIDAARLAALKPDFQDEEHRAWRLSTLLGDHALYAITGENDVMVQFRRAPEKEPQPALMLTRRGEPVALLIDPTDPFPSYHGQGRRLGRPGDPMPRIAGVKQIRVEDPK
jgi:hypothetical protein